METILEKRGGNNEIDLTEEYRKLLESIHGKSWEEIEANFPSKNQAFFERHYWDFRWLLIVLLWGVGIGLLLRCI